MLELLIVGFIGSISALRHTAKGKAVCNMSVAQSKPNGETVWHKVVCWGTQAEACVKHLSKGSYVVVKSDNYVPKTYKAKDGSVQCSVEFWASRVVFGPKAKNAAPVAAKQESCQEPSEDFSDDDMMPF